MQTFKQDFIQSAKIIILALLIAVGTSYVSAVTTWTAPSTTPPNGNVDAPVNVGYSPQIKSGNLWIKGLANSTTAAVNGLIVENGRVGIGTTNPYGILGVRPAANENLMVGPGIAITGAVAISATNDSNTVNTPLEVRASKTTFTTGDVCTTYGGTEKCLSTGASSGELITRTCTNAQSLSGGSQAVAACVAAVNSNNTWRAINCKRSGVGATEVTTGDFIKYSSGKWVFQMLTGGTNWSDFDCVDGSVVVVKVNATSGGGGVLTHSASAEGSCNTRCAALGRTCGFGMYEAYWGGMDATCDANNPGVRWRCWCN